MKFSVLRLWAGGPLYCIQWASGPGGDLKGHLKFSGLLARGNGAEPVFGSNLVGNPSWAGSPRAKINDHLLLHVRSKLSVVFLSTAPLRSTTIIGGGMCGQIVEFIKNFPR